MAEKIKIEKIAIHLPLDQEQRLLSLPFLHLIKQAYPSSEIYLIVERHEIEFLTAIPFEAFYLEYKIEDFKTIFHIHRFHRSWPPVVFDKYYSLVPGWKSAFLGWLTGAGSRIGFTAPWVKWFYTQTVTVDFNEHFTDTTFHFYEQVTQLKVPIKLKVNGKRYPPFYQHLNQYLAIDIYPFSPGEVDPFWEEYFNLSENRTFVIFSSHDVEKGALLIEQLMKRLNPANRYYHFINAKKIELMQMLSHAQGLVSRDTPIALLNSYLGGNGIIIYEQKDPRFCAPYYFYSDWQLIDLQDQSKRQAEEHGLLTKRKQVKAEVLLDLVEKFFISEKKL